MFDSAFRTLFLSNPARLSLKSNNLRIGLMGESCLDSQTAPKHQESYKSDKKDEITIPLSDILCIIIESRQITLSSSLLNAFAQHKILVFICDDAHLPSGIFTPFLGHYRSLSVLESQISLSKQKKAILWQQIIKAKIANQAALLAMLHRDEAELLEILAKNVQLMDSSHLESQAARIYFRALFGKGFVRNADMSPESSVVNAALNYGYAIVRGMIVRSLCASGLNPALGIFHKNQFNPFNLADDVIEPYRVFIDSLVVKMLESNNLHESLRLENRVVLAEILSTQILLQGKLYPLSRAVIASVQSLSQSIESGRSKLQLPIFQENQSNGREVYESACDV